MKSKPNLIVVASTVHPNLGSEPGKGWWWSSALSPFYRLHIITQKDSLRYCEGEALPIRDEWTFHPTSRSVTTWKIPTGYMQYARWLGEVMGIARSLIREIPVAGLCHLTLGSFRILPPYQRLGIPYTVGPIGGGECSPMPLLWSRNAPVAHKVSETLRPLVNGAFALVPPLRAALRRSSLTLATSVETERVLRRMGARTTKAVFPDAFDQPVEVDAIDRLRASQKPLVNGEIRLLWQGRALWWKAPDLALMALRESLVRGVRVRLTMITDWSSPVGVAIRTMAENMGISSSVDFSGFMSREDLLRTAREHHAFFATSMHDSGGIPLIEAQSQGLPCLTPALGGNRDAHCPETGLRSPVQDGASFARGVAECLLGWQADPDVWARESSLAVRHATTFTRARIEQYAKNLIIPALQDRKISKAQ
jgi:glycosyltransferase involved in cell wall biosynthesis